METSKLVELCDEFFSGYWKQDYPGSIESCVYCGAFKKENKKDTPHSPWCPVARYRKMKIPGEVDLSKMKEYQFRVPVWLDVHADSVDEAVKALNSSLHLLDEPLPAPGRIQRVQVDTRKPVTKADIVSVQDLYTRE